MVYIALQPLRHREVVLKYLCLYLCVLVLVSVVLGKKSEESANNVVSGNTRVQGGKKGDGTPIENLTYLRVHVDPN